MMEYITAADIEAQAKLVRAVFKGTIVVVEGDTDARVFERLLDRALSLVIPARSRANALHSVEALNAQGFGGIVAIVDADFARLVGAEGTAQNVFLTDWHDLEVMLVESSAFEVVVREYASGAKLARFGTDGTSKVRAMVYAATRPIGALRLLSALEELALNFEGFEPAKVVERDTMKVDTNSLVSRVLGRSGRSLSERVRIGERVAQISARADFDSREMCCGHDLVAVFCVALRGPLGSMTRRAANAQEIERALRLAFDLSAFRTMELYRRLLGWEAANGPFHLFPADATAA